MVVRRNGRGFVKYLEEELGLRRRTVNEHVPTVVLLSEWAVQREFLRGLFTDCSVSESRKEPTIDFNTVSPRLAREVRVMLMNAGVYSTVARPRLTWSGQRYFRLHFGSRDAMRFAQLVGFIEPQRTRQFERWAER